MRLSSWRRTDCHSFLADINLWLQFLLSSVELGFLASLQHGLLCCVLPVGGLGHCTGPTSALRPPTPTPTLPLQLYIRTLNGFVLYRDSVTGPRASWIAWNCVFFSLSLFFRFYFPAISSPCYIWLRVFIVLLWFVFVFFVHLSLAVGTWKWLKNRK